MNNNIKWGSIIPLIGGMTIGNKKVTGTDPDLIISYSAFSDNDQHCLNYFKNTPYLEIDAITNMHKEDNKIKINNFDFISTVCPCAGLSQLNSSKNTLKGRGSDAIQNEWMYKSSSYVLENIKPKVFWGENAPGLYGKAGVGVVEKLRKIGEKYGYVFSMIKTDTFLHGIPQHRHRSFYFFWKSNRVPILSWYKKESPVLEEYLNQIPVDAKDMDRYFSIGPANENAWFKFLESENFTYKDLVNSKYGNVFDYVKDGRIDKAIEWATLNNEKKILNFLNRAKIKIKNGGGLWVDTPIVFKDYINALVGRYTIMHPSQPRGITIREAMWLMGLPHDFRLNTNSVNCTNHICQNVPTDTAADWTREVIKFINNDIQEWGGVFVKQNNETQKIDLSVNKIHSII